MQLKITQNLIDINGDMQHLKAVPRAAIAPTQPRPRPLLLPRPFLAGRPGPLPRPLTLFLVAAGMSMHNTPWSLTFLFKAGRDGESGDSGAQSTQSNVLNKMKF